MVYFPSLPMWKPKLNRHFANCFPALKVSAFLLIWNGIFHSLTLSILLYWSLTSNRVPELSRMSTLNQFWTENQLLFATLCSVAAMFFFKDQLWQTLRRWKQSQKYFFANFSRGALFGLILILGLIFNHRYEFLGFAVQLNLNFLTSYAWIFRAFLILALVASNEFLVRIVTESTFDRETPFSLTYPIRMLTELAIYWIWFNPSLSECFTLLLLFSLFSHFWSATGFLSGLFIMTHAVFSLPFFENEFLGLFQLKLLKNDDRFYQNPYLQVTLLILLIAFKLIPQYSLFRKRKEVLHP